MGMQVSALKTSDNIIIGYRVHSTLGCFDLSEDFCRHHSISVAANNTKCVSIVDNAFRTDATDTVPRLEDINLVRLLFDNSVACRYGADFIAINKQNIGFKQRFCFDELYHAVTSAFNNIILYEVRRTGKSVLLYHVAQR